MQYRNTRAACLPFGCGGREPSGSILHSTQKTLRRALSAGGEHGTHFLFPQLKKEQ